MHCKFVIVTATIHLLICAVSSKEQQPTVFVSFTVDRTVSHVLPWFFGGLERQTYPKTRVVISIAVTDNSFPLHCDDEMEPLTDNSLFCKWIQYAKSVYHSVELQSFAKTGSEVESMLRFYDHSLAQARSKWADYLLILDVHDLIVHRNTLKWMVAAALANQHVVVSALTVLPVSHHSEDLLLKNEEVTFDSIERSLKLRGTSATENNEYECLQPDAARTIHTPFLVDLRDRSMHGVSFWSALSHVYDSYYDSSSDISTIPARSQSGQSRIAAHAANAIQVAFARARKLPSLSIFDLSECLLVPTALRLRKDVLVYRFDYGTNVPNLAFGNKDTTQLHMLETLRHFIVNTFLLDGTPSLSSSRLLSEFSGEAPYSVLLEALSNRQQPSSPFLMSSSIGNGATFIAPELETFVINLRRRPDRLERIAFSLRSLQMRFLLADAVDGQAIGVEALQQMGVRTMRGYYDVYSGRRYLTLGEVGCFLSHYNVWRAIVAANVTRALVLEDDAVLARGFAPRLARLLSRLDASDAVSSEFDLMYVGRRHMSNGVRDVGLPLFDADHHSNVELAYLKKYFSQDHVVIAGYSHWTVGYLLTQRGARKLLEREPLSKLVAVDEYLPLVAGTHPNAGWVNRFVVNSNGEYDPLVTLATEPLLVEPMLYTTSENYVTDTEHSTQFPSEDEIDDELQSDSASGDDEYDKEYPLDEQVEGNVNDQLPLATETFAIEENTFIRLDSDYKEEL